MASLLHITTRQAWAQAQRQGRYEPDSLVDERFIHCSSSDQILGPANAYYRGQSDLLLLQIDAARVEADIRYEDCYASGQTFPHIYGPLNLEAVTAVFNFPAGADGTFSLPPGIAEGPAKR